MFSMWRIPKGQFLVITLSIIGIEFIPATLSASTSTHIVSYVHQKKLKRKFDEFADFDSVNASEKKTKHGSFSLLAGSLVKLMDMNIDANIERSTNSPNSSKQSDDAPSQYLNTLQNATDMSNNHTQHELEMSNIGSDIPGSRVKQSIPVLEPVKHLLNTVRDGALGTPNHTSPSLTAHHTPHSKHPHQLLGSAGTDQAQESGGVQHHDSPAVETEEEREMVNESTGFHFLELLGTLGGMVWGFFTNVQKVFAASSGGASAASSSSSSGLSE